MNVSSWLRKTAISRLDAELILANSLGKDRVFLHAHPEFELSEDAEKRADADCLRRENHEPLAYILGYKNFYGRKFMVTPDVLIPRPETEAIINLAKELKSQKILDVGTGSGCIAITLKLELPDSDVVALDISPKALKIAEQNAAKLGAKIAFRESDRASGCCAFIEKYCLSSGVSSADFAIAFKYSDFCRIWQNRIPTAMAYLSSLFHRRHMRAPQPRNSRTYTQKGRRAVNVSQLRVFW